jgi:hypothetical protein
LGISKKELHENDLKASEGFATVNDFEQQVHLK